MAGSENVPMRTLTASRDLRALLFSGLALLIGYLDYITGPNVSLTLLYLLPVVGAAWLIGHRGGMTVAIVAGITSLVDVTFGYENSSAVLVWNTVSRTVILAIAAVAVARMRTDRRRLVVQDVQRARSLELLDRGLTDPARHLVDLATHWDGSTEELKKLVRRSADEIAFLARDFSEMVRLQSGELPLRPASFDFVELIEELRTEQASADRRILITGPAGPLRVMGDRARIRQSLDALVSERAAGDELSLLLDRKGDSAELVITSGGYRPSTGARVGEKDDLGMTAELAELLFAAQGGSVKLARNPLTRSLRVTARLPLA
jgi:hypothetical protein